MVRGRRLLLVAAVVAIVAAACGGGGSELQAKADACKVDEVDGDLSLYNWSEYIDPELVEKFKATYGVEVTETFFESNESMLAQVEAGGAVYDLVVPSDYMVDIMRQEGLLVKLNREAIPNLANLDPKFTNLPFDPGNEYSAPYLWGTTGIGFSYDVVDDAADLTWGLIFDPELSAPFAGKISLLDDEREVFAAALKYLGYSVNSKDEKELQEATELLKAAKDRVATFTSDSFEDLLVAGEVVIAHGWNGDFFSAFDEADAWEELGYGIPKEGGVAWVDNMAIPTTAEHVCTAQTFINFILDPENGAQLAEWNYYASPNAKANELIDPEMLSDPAVYPPPEVFEKLEFLEDLGDFATKYADAFTEVKS
ncbi:MAG TPA: spermidine/putrescine ABC transporter substrate-binding protein [Actinobacteria bacterium]|nr:spermidine/putrescine ABC transporter substrate-binding protein [Actinomycetota bacterium]